MALSLEEFLAEHPVDEKKVQLYKEKMLAEVRGYRLRELREAAGFTQSELASKIGVSQRQVSKIERGDIENSRIGTIRSYLRAVGGDLSLDFIHGDLRVHVA